MTPDVAAKSAQTLPTIPLNPFTGALALLAFIMAFYGLVIRERKSQYLLRPLLSTAFVFLAVLALSLLEAVARKFGRPDLAAAFGNLSATALLFGVGLVWYRLIDINNRIFHLRTDKWIKNTRALQWLRAQKEKWTAGSTYEHNPRVFGEELRDAIANTSIISRADLDGSLDRSGGEALALSISAPDLSMATEATTKLATAFLAENFFVQYACCGRHPIEFIRALKTESGDHWKDYTERVVVVDAYTPHFGFLDSTHRERTRELASDNVKVVASRDSFSGLHTAAAKAFNIIKRRSKKKKLRPPTLVIYESLFALADAESVEQHRIFIRHLLPSERQWGGMLTVLVESDPDPRALEPADTYVDARVRLGDSEVES